LARQERQECAIYMGGVGQRHGAVDFAGLGHTQSLRRYPSLRWSREVGFTLRRSAK
jgi:hypothetical protein